MDFIALPVDLSLEIYPDGAVVGSLERAVSATLSEVVQPLWATAIRAHRHPRW